MIHRITHLIARSPFLSTIAVWLAMRASDNAGRRRIVNTVTGECRQETAGESIAPPRVG